MTVVLAVWAVTVVAAHAAVSVTGVVKDPSGAPVGGATVVIMTAEQASIATGRTDAQGKFSLQVPSAGRYLLVATAPQLGESRIPLSLGETNPSPIEVVLEVGPLREDVTVTASPNLVEDVRRVGQPVSVVDSLDIATPVSPSIA